MENKKYIFDVPNFINKEDTFEIFSGCFAIMTYIQNNMHELVEKGRDWQVDMDKGTIFFGDDKYSIQVIGSESISDDTWLWGWTNVSGFNEKVLALSHEIKSIGEDWNFNILTEEGWYLDNAMNGHNFSILSSVIVNKNICYYRCPHDNGALFVAITDAPQEIFRKANIVEAISTITKAADTFGAMACHKIMSEAFFIYNDNEFNFDENTKKLTADFDSQKIEIEFEYTDDDAYRVLSIKTI